MNKNFKKFLYIICMVILCISIFLLSFILSLKDTFFNVEFQRDLFKDIKLHTKIQKVVDELKENLISNLDNASLEKNQQTKALISVLENSTKPSNIKNNIDNIREETILYFKGENMILPNITIDTNTGLNTNLDTIKKINLSTILSYTYNSNYYKTILTFIKLNYYILDQIIDITLLLLIGIFLSYILILTNIQDLKSFVKKITILSLILFIGSLISIIIYYNMFLPEDITFIESNIPELVVLLKDYINTLLIGIFTRQVFYYSVILFGMYFSYFLLKVYLKLVKNEKFRNLGFSRMIKNAILLGVIISGVIYITYKSMNTYVYLEKNTYFEIFPRLVENKVTTEIVPAKDDTIYVLQVKLINNKTKEAIKEKIDINVTGHALKSNVKVNESVILDENSIGKITLDKGKYTLNFKKESFPKAYLYPKEFDFEIIKPGITILTFPIRPNEEKENPVYDFDSYKFVEFEILDEEYNPISNVEIELINNENNTSNSKESSVSHNKGKLFSYTNVEGIGIFKLKASTYTVNINSPKGSNDYVPHPSFNIDILQEELSLDLVDKYTIQLLKRKLEN